MEERIVAGCVGLAFILIGCLLSTNERFADWGIRHGKARIWVAIFGYEGAMKLTRYFFGPFTVVLGLIGIAIFFTSN